MQNRGSRAAPDRHSRTIFPLALQARVPSWLRPVRNRNRTRKILHFIIYRLIRAKRPEQALSCGNSFALSRRVKSRIGQPCTHRFSHAQVIAITLWEGFIRRSAQIFRIYRIFASLYKLYAELQRKPHVSDGLRCVLHSFCIVHPVQFVVLFLVQNVVLISCTYSFCPATYGNRWTHRADRDPTPRRQAVQAPARWGLGCHALRQGAKQNTRTTDRSAWSLPR